MQDVTETEFEWDERKRESTLEKHEIDFLDATRIFDGRTVVHARSNHPDEERWIATSKLSGQMVSVVYPFRGDRVRIITVRQARKNEQREYNKNHPKGCDPPQG